MFTDLMYKEAFEPKYSLNYSAPASRKLANEVLEAKLASSLLRHFNAMALFVKWLLMKLTGSILIICLIILRFFLKIRTVNS
jgi:hypothetical protein